MATFPFLSVLAALVLTPPQTPVDLAGIDRSLAREPAYESRLPKYCLLAIGPEAKSRHWLVVDGHELYFDRNGNRDLTEPGERVAANPTSRPLHFQVGMFQDANGKSRALELRIREFDFASGKCAGLVIILDDKCKQFVGFDEANPFRFGHRPEQAPIVHVEGPLQMRVYGEPPTLAVDEETDLNVSIGTPGVGPGSFCAIQCCTVLNCKVSPVATLEFPRRAADQPPLQVRIPIADD
jgi:hypothetical protein